MRHRQTSQLNTNNSVELQHFLPPPPLFFNHSSTVTFAKMIRVTGAWKAINTHLKREEHASTFPWRTSAIIAIGGSNLLMQKGGEGGGGRPNRLHRTRPSPYFAISRGTKGGGSKSMSGFGRRCACRVTTNVA